MRVAGVRGDRPVVLYDADGGIAAPRGWWLLRYFGHRNVMVLDGGLAAWVQAGQPVTCEAPVPAAGDFIARPGGMSLLDAADAGRLGREGVLLDARVPERFAGKVEPVDPVAGHIPGARNRPAAENVDDLGRFRAPDELRRGFEALGVREDVHVGAYCGSGVAAAQEVLALELAGYRAGLYLGSWSEWSADLDRPVSRSD